MLLIDCFYLSLDRRPESQRGQVLKAIPAYLAATARLSREFRTLHIATHALFRRLLQHCPPDVFCNEPVHPNLTGHLAIAEAVYAALS